MYYGHYDHLTSMLSEIEFNRSYDESYKFSEYSVNHNYDLLCNWGKTVTYIW